MRSLIYLLSLCLIPIIAFTAGCDKQDKKKEGFGPNPGDGVVEDSAE